MSDNKEKSMLERFKTYLEPSSEEVVVRALEMYEGDGRPILTIPSGKHITIDYIKDARKELKQKYGVKDIARKVLSDVENVVENKIHELRSVTPSVKFYYDPFEDEIDNLAIDLYSNSNNWPTWKGKDETKIKPYINWGFKGNFDPRYQKARELVIEKLKQKPSSVKTKITKVSVLGKGPSEKVLKKILEVYRSVQETDPGLTFNIDNYDEFKEIALEELTLKNRVKSTLGTYKIKDGTDYLARTVGGAERKVLSRGYDLGNRGARGLYNAVNKGLEEGTEWWNTTAEGKDETNGEGVMKGFYDMVHTPIRGLGSVYNGAKKVYDKVDNYAFSAPEGKKSRAYRVLWGPWVCEAFGAKPDPGARPIG